jgi:hypothetical protein
MLCMKAHVVVVVHSEQNKQRARKAAIYVAMNGPFFLVYMSDLKLCMWRGKTWTVIYRGLRRQWAHFITIARGFRFVTHTQAVEQIRGDR